MVYCTKCGTLNPDASTVCSNCGAPLQAAGAQPQDQAKPYYRHGHRHDWENWEGHYEYSRRSGGFAALAIGAIITLIGLSAFAAEEYGVDIPWGGIVLIFIGLLIIVAGIQARSHWHRYDD